MSFKVSWKIHFLCLIVACVICFFMKNFINNIFLALVINDVICNITGNVLVDTVILLIMFFVPITAVHELLHGSAYKLFGGKVKYGFKIIYAYTQETSGIVLHRTKFLMVLLAPVTIISAISLLVPGYISEIIFTLNFLGSLGDFVMAFYLCKSNENSYIIDRKYGFDIVDGHVSE